jgi:transposase
MRDIDKQPEACLEQAGYQPDYKRCQRIPGVWPVVSTALVSTYHRGPFHKADAFIAYLGIDVRVRESGKYTGQRKLTKKGNAEIRRLLFNGAMAGVRTAYWRDYYDRLRQRGLSSTAAYVAVGRKIARIAFALMQDRSDFVPER